MRTTGVGFGRGRSGFVTARGEEIVTDVYVLRRVSVNIFGVEKQYFILRVYLLS
jgi:hypothetical protein